MIRISNPFSEIAPLPDGRWKLLTAVGAGAKLAVVDTRSNLEGVRKSHRPRHVVRVVRTTGDSRPDSHRGAVYVLVDHVPLLCPRCQQHPGKED
jgi:hypothetical protein